MSFHSRLHSHVAGRDSLRPALRSFIFAMVAAGALLAMAGCARDAPPGVPDEAEDRHGSSSHSASQTRPAVQAPPGTTADPASDPDAVLYWTCSMHPSVKQAGPGTCPICSMDLVPVRRSEAETGVIRIDAARRQLIGVRTSPVVRRPLTVTIRAEAQVKADETRLADVSLKYRGWVGRVHVDKPGQRVERDQPLFDLYSPELYAAQEEFLSALASQVRARQTSVPDRADYLVDAARQRLRLWDLRPEQIDALARRAAPLEYVPILSPASGHVISKAVVEGSPVEAGTPLYRIAGLDTIWIEADLYEYELPLVEIGQQVRVELAYLPGGSIPGHVSFVYPYLDRSTRTGRIRVALDNPGLQLKPDMYAEVILQVARGERLAVPEEAVIFAGPRRVVFLDLGDGRLQPRAITLGVKADWAYEVLDGLQEGDLVVTSGNFLVAAESRLKSAMEQW